MVLGLALVVDVDVDDSDSGSSPEYLGLGWMGAVTTRMTRILAIGTFS